MLLAAVVRQQGPDSFAALLPQLIAAAGEGPMQVRRVGAESGAAGKTGQLTAGAASRRRQAADCGAPSRVPAPLPTHPPPHTHPPTHPPNPPKAEISCLVLQFVAEDITQFEERAGEWRRSFLSALVASVDSVFPFLVKVGGQEGGGGIVVVAAGQGAKGRCRYEAAPEDSEGPNLLSRPPPRSPRPFPPAQLLQDSFSAGLAASQQPGAAPPDAARAHAAVVNAALGALSSYVEWAPLGRIGGGSVVEACAFFLTAPDFREAALGVLKQVGRVWGTAGGRGVWRVVRGPPAAWACLAARSAAAADACRAPPPPPPPPPPAAPAAADLQPQVGAGRRRGRALRGAYRKGAPVPAASGERRRNSPAPQAAP
jgi:hypothetical protein